MRTLSCDVVIIGAGTSGTFAALYLAQKGFKIAIIERTPLIGGALTNSLVYPTAGFHTPNFQEITTPMIKKILKELISQNLSLGHIRDPLQFASTITPITPTAYKLITQKLLKNKNCLLFTLANIKKIKYSNNEIKSVIFSSYNQYYEIKAKFFIDSTGILLTSYFIPIDYYFDKENLQAITLIFKISNINFKSILKDIKNNPSEFYRKTNPDLIEKQNFLSVSGYYSLAKKYLNKPNLLLNRDRFLFFSDIDKNSVIVNTTRVFLKDIEQKYPPNNENEIKFIEQKAYQILLKQVFYIHKIMKENIEGFKNSYISEIANFVGIRQFRNIKGLYTLSLQDVKNGTYFEDSISIGTWPIDIHISNSIIENNINPNGYGIPLRSCLNNYKNLVFIGKNISADKYSFSSARIQATLMVMGENIGRILEYCLNKKINPIDLDISEVRKNTHLT